LAGSERSLKLQNKQQLRHEKRGCKRSWQVKKACTSKKALIFKKNSGMKKGIRKDPFSVFYIPKFKCISQNLLCWHSPGLHFRNLHILRKRRETASGAGERK
jgi:hypothetical protein